MASGPGFPGDPSSFAALSTKILLLDKLGRRSEAGEALKKALPLGNVNQLQQFGRQMITAKNPQAALEIFQFNFNKHPDQFITLVGMARGLSANGELAKALDYAEKALPLAPNEANKKMVQEMIDKIKAGKDVN